MTQPEPEGEASVPVPQEAPNPIWTCWVRLLGEAQRQALSEIKERYPEMFEGPSPEDQARGSYDSDLTRWSEIDALVANHVLTYILRSSAMSTHAHYTGPRCDYVEARRRLKLFVQDREDYLDRALGE